MEDIVFLGDWIKDRVLGSGSFGVVTLWKHKETDEKLAVKMCKWGDELTAKHKERWSKEVEMLQNCNNPNIVATKQLPSEFLTGLERVNTSKLPILCMEYCSGGDLRQVLNKCESSCGLREFDVRQILSDIGNAMTFLHDNKITHRDLKPENIVMQLLDTRSYEIGSQLQKRVLYKLIDLGYAKEIDAHSVCASFVGTLQYLAPEILYSKTYSNSVDFWSLGLLAFEIACGVRPFLPFMAPVQWMPHVKKKASDNICVYETYHGDIEYSNEIFPENHMSAPFKALLEKWLRIALEWDPKLRGRDVPLKGVTFNLPDKSNLDLHVSNVVIFSVLDDILSRKIMKIFCVSHVIELAYEIDSSTTVFKLKTLIEKEMKIPVQEQVLISRTTYTEMANEDLVEHVWNDQCTTMIFLYNRSYIIADNIEPLVPKAVQRCLEHPKSLYNFKNSKDLYKSGLFFVMSQKELYHSFITGLSVRAESLKQEGRQLVLKHNLVDKAFEKLTTKQETIGNMIEMGKKHISVLKENGTGTNLLGGFEGIFQEADEIADKVKKLQNAWSQLTVRLQSAARRSNEVLSVDLNSFISKYNFEIIVNEAFKAYLSYKKNERDFRMGEKQCHDIMKVCYNCLKSRSKIFLEVRHQTFVLKIIDVSTEFCKISDTINTASENIERIMADLTALSEKLTNCTWTTISVLSSGENDLTDLPYSVVSFQKRDFKIGDSVSNHCIKVGNIVDANSDLTLLIRDSLKIKKNCSILNNNIQQQKNILNSDSFDFSFLHKNTE